MDNMNSSTSRHTTTLVTILNIVRVRKLGPTIRINCKLSLLEWIVTSTLSSLLVRVMKLWNDLSSIVVNCGNEPDIRIFKARLKKYMNIY
jgi:hypothetical protein